MMGREVLRKGVAVEEPDIPSKGPLSTIFKCWTVEGFVLPALPREDCSQRNDFKGGRVHTHARGFQA